MENGDIFIGQVKVNHFLKILVIRSKVEVAMAAECGDSLLSQIPCTQVLLHTGSNSVCVGSGAGTIPPDLANFLCPVKTFELRYGNSLNQSEFINV